MIASLDARCDDEIAPKDIQEIQRSAVRRSDLSVEPD